MVAPNKNCDGTPEDKPDPEAVKMAVELLAIRAIDHVRMGRDVGSCSCRNCQIISSMHLIIAQSYACALIALNGNGGPLSMLVTACDKIQSEYKDLFPDHPPQSPGNPQ